MKKHLFLIALILIVSFIYSKGYNQTSYLEEYINNPSLKEPTLQDYKRAGIDSVNRYNLKATNSDLKLLLKKNQYFFYEKSHYHYYPEFDYIYDFNQSSAKIINLPLKNGKIALNNTPIDSNESVFLKVKLLSNTLGKYFNPYINIISKNRVYKESFEKNTEGIRYLNITDLIDSSSKEIELESKLFNIPNQIVSLIKFKKPTLKNKKIMIIAPHPDDAEIAAYGLYSSYPKDSYVITVTAGDAGPSEIYGKLYKSIKTAFKEKGKARVIDSITVPLLADIPAKNTLNLGFFDGKLYKMYENREKVVSSFYTKSSNIAEYRKYNISSLASNLDAKANWVSLVNNLKQLITIIKPDIIVTPYPAIDQHADHRMSTIAIFEALKSLNKKDGKLFLYTNHLPNSEFYPFGKRGTPITLPPIFRKLYFDSLYSHKVPLNTQNEKLLALERMSDIRYTYEGDPSIPYCYKKSPISCNDYSYFRRAVRANELFFVVDINNLYNNDIYNQLLSYKNPIPNFKYIPLEKIYSKIQNFNLRNSYTNEIKYHIDKIKNNNKFTTIEGWAFLKNKKEDNIKIFIVLKGGNKNIVLSTSPIIREDVARVFRDKSLAKAGFRATIKNSDILKGEYSIQILLIDKENKQYLTNTPNRVLF